MTTVRTLSVLLAACMVLAQLQATQAAGPIPADELTFPNLRDAWNATKQWRLAMATSHTDAPFVPVNCSNPIVGACHSLSTPLEQGEEASDRLLVNWTLATPRLPDGGLATYKGMNPTKVQIRACFTTNSSVNRAWRTKNKPYPRLSQACPRTLVTYPFNGSATAPDLPANTGSFVWELKEEDEVPVATWFLMLWLYCGDEQVCAFESTEGRPDLNPPVAGDFFETNVVMGVTPGMTAAAIVLSVLSVLYFVTFLAADHLYYKKHGRPLVIC